MSPSIQDRPISYATQVEREAFVQRYVQNTSGEVTIFAEINVPPGKGKIEQV